MSAVCTAAWSSLKGKTETVHDTVMDGAFWQELDMFLEFLWPFSQAIHHLEGDRPHLSDCHITLLQLEKHVNAWAEKLKAVELLSLGWTGRRLWWTGRKCWPLHML
jgi:hypothetical protein